MRMSKELAVTYDADVDAAYIYLTKIAAGGVKRTYCCDPSEVGGTINLDFDDDGCLLGIEILSASKKLPTELIRSSEVD